MPKTYAVASAKGGVGKTTTAANLAATLAAAGYDTVAVDADLATANLGRALGVEPEAGSPTLHDVLAGEAEPAEAIREGPHGLAVLPGSPVLDDFRKADPAGLPDLLESITTAEYVIVDTGSGLSHESALPLSVADGVLLVSTPTRDGLADTHRTQELTERLGGEVVGLALTRAKGDEDTGAVDVPVLGSIPDVEVVREANEAGVPLSVHAPTSDAAASFRSLASSLTGKPVRPPVDVKEARKHAGATEEDEESAEPETESAESADEESTADAEAESDAGEEPEPEAEPAETAQREPEAETEPAPESEAEPEIEPEPDSGSEPESEADADAGTEPASASEADAVEESASEAPPSEEGESPAEAEGDTDSDDAVIIDDAGEEDEAAAAARRTVLGEEEYEEERHDAPTVEDAESGESAEIGEDVIPFAQEGRERTERAKEGAGGDEDEDDDERGFLGRLFR